MVYLELLGKVSTLGLRFHGTLILSARSRPPQSRGKAAELSKRSAGPTSNQFHVRPKMPMVFPLGWSLIYILKKSGGNHRQINPSCLPVCLPAKVCIAVLGFGGHPISSSYCLAFNCCPTFCQMDPAPCSLTSPMESSRVILRVPPWSALPFLFFNRSLAIQESELVPRR